MTSRTVLNKAAALALLVAALALPHPTPSRVRVVLFAFGAFNVLVPVPGALLVRIISTLCTLGALVSSDEIAGGMLIMSLLFWPPLVMVAWAFSRERVDASYASPKELEPSGRGARRTLAAIVAAVAVASLAYQAMSRYGLDQTSALFVGLPSLLAMVVIMGVAPRTAAGVAVKATSVGLLLSFVSLREGGLCIVVASPIFYGVAVGVALAIDAARRSGNSTTMTSLAIVLVAGPMSLEGVIPATSFNRGETVGASKIVHASSEAIARALVEPPRFERGRPRPLFLRLGFPTPVSGRIEPSPDRTRWVIEIRGGEMLLNGMESKTGYLVMNLEESRPRLVRWRAVSDTSHMGHFLRFRESIVRWEPIDAQTTRVTWTIRYDRGLDPAWYFGPMQRYAVGLTAGYLIDAVATP